MSNHTAPPMTSATQNQTVATEMALRTLSIRRRSARNAGMAMPFGSSRSLGRTSGRSAAWGTMVLAMASILRELVK